MKTTIGLKLHNVTLHDGTYPFMSSQNIFVDGLKSDPDTLPLWIADMDFAVAPQQVIYTTGVVPARLS